MKIYKELFNLLTIIFLIFFFTSLKSFGQGICLPWQCTQNSDCSGWSDPPPLTTCCVAESCDGGLLYKCEQLGCQCDPVRYCAGGATCCSPSIKDCICGTPECPGCMSGEKCINNQCYKEFICPCSSAILREEAEKHTPVLIKFGEAVMTRSNIGRDFEKNYSRHNKELNQIFLTDEELRIQARGFIQRYIEIFREVGENNITQGTLNRVFTPGDAKTLRIFISRIEDQASPELRELMVGLAPYIDQFEGHRFSEILEFLGLI